MRNIHDLEIYRKSLLLTKEIYELVRKNPSLTKDYSLCDQIKRASVSVASNISEGFCLTRKLTKNYLSIASGSTNEVATQLEVIMLVYEINTKKLQEEYIILGKQINALSAHF